MRGHTLKGAKRRIFEILTGQRKLPTTHAEARRLLANLECEMVRDTYGQRTTMERHKAQEVDADVVNES